MKRRKFLNRVSAATALIASGYIPARALEAYDLTKLTILHTNDVHSRIDPFPMDGSRNQGLGGVARRAELIRSVRKSEEHVLLLDAGDIFQGTPYFNVFGGELEFKLMSEMQYDAATIGNHDFDAGIDGLYQQMPHASFPFVICNYDFSDTVMHDQVIPSIVFEKGPLRIGVLGVGIEMEGLVPAGLYGNTRYLDPVKCANTEAARLRFDEKCHYVICLSHLGYRYRGDKVSDRVLAGSSRNIDLIIGGHTHTFMDGPEIIRNLDDNPVFIHQVGWAGILLGRLDVHFERNFRQRCTTCKNVFVKPS